ncbi:hypothetical protein HQQ81_10485 [Microbacteriaceae bacterium VKM Ac-2854]|nr:hypothetical protein [Microbacteriaceae bacterium VKM Ac-2854]
MSDASARTAYEDLTLELADEEGVSVADDALLVNEEEFAYLDGEALVVKLPEDRAADLREREVAVAQPDAEGWVRVEDTELWSELAGEAYEFVGEPAVGGES